MTKTFTWPEPKYLPASNSDGEVVGTKMNPERVEEFFRFMNQELVIGEQFSLIEMILDGTEFELRQN